MSVIKKLLKSLVVISIVPIVYFVTALICSYIPINQETNDIEKKHSLYLSSNGIHLEIIIPKTELDTKLLYGLKHKSSDAYFSFGWGEKTYYQKTATSSDFSFVDKCNAAFVNTSALLHVTRYNSIKNHWIEIKMTSSQLLKLNSYIQNTFRLTNKNEKIILPTIAYSNNDNFYESHGKYNGFNTCNTWVNTGLKQSKAKACLWTPFDFGLLHMYQK